MTKKDSNIDFTLPSNEADRTKIRKMLQELSGQLQMIDDRKAAAKDIVDALYQQYKIPKKIISKLAKTIHNDDYDDVSHETSLFETVYEVIIANTNSSNSIADDADGID